MAHALQGVTPGTQCGLRLPHPKTPVVRSVLPLLAVHALERRYVQVMAERRAYPSDLSDARWELIEPVLSAWRAERRRHALSIGRPPEQDLRRIMDAILYVDRTGIPWRYLPHDFAPWETVHGYFAFRQKEGVF